MTHTATFDRTARRTVHAVALRGAIASSAADRIRPRAENISTASTPRRTDTRWTPATVARITDRELAGSRSEQVCTKCHLVYVAGCDCQ
jgi:hypothetical protein